MTPEPVNESSVAVALAQVTSGKDLTAAEARAAMTALMAGVVSEDLTKRFLVALRVKGEVRAEVRGFLDAMRAAGRAVTGVGAVVDVVGTGGDGHHSLNISTMAALVLAAADIPVVKHGNRAATSQCGAADVLASLGVSIDLEPAQVLECFHAVGIAFCLAPVFHPAMRHVASVRRSLPHPTVFNLLGPLANPAHASVMLVGVANAMRAPMLESVLSDSGVRAAVVCADDGMDEISTVVPTTLWAQGSSARIEPAALGIMPAPSDALRGGDPDYNAAMFKAVMDPNTAADVAHIRDCVILNAAVARALWTAEATAADICASLPAHIAVLREVVASGAAMARLTRWIDVSQTLSTRS